MKNFEFKNVDENGVEQSLWYSRSVAVGLFVFAHNILGKWYVLAAKRGSGCPSAVGKWNCPGGFVDFDETLEQAAIRECYEETGIKIPIDKIQFNEINSSPSKSSRQTIGVSFYAILNTPVEELVHSISNANNEINETTDIKFIAVEDMKKYHWAFNHYRRVNDVYNKYVNISKIKKLWRALLKKICI